MKLSQFDYHYPESLVAVEPRHPPRVWLNSAENGQKKSRELGFKEVFELFRAGDVLLVNDTLVEKRRVVTPDGLEILFIDSVEPFEWQVLFQAKAFSLGDRLNLPGGYQAEIVAKGLPQKLKILSQLPADYFDRFGEPALPPYIQKARNERRARSEDSTWYQTQWAKQPGSSAAPTASLHFSKTALEELQARGVQIGWLTLHVGLGTFLPVKTEDLKDHQMHQEWVEISERTLKIVREAKQNGARVWALGTTALRSIEAWAQGHLTQQDDRSVTGHTDLYILPGYEFKIVNALLTNFHQPRSTLLALVAAFYGHQDTLKAYELAIENQFRLFSYGDLSVWIPQP